MLKPTRITYNVPLSYLIQMFEVELDINPVAQLVSVGYRYAEDDPNQKGPPVGLVVHVDTQ